MREPKTSRRLRCRVRRRAGVQLRCRRRRYSGDRVSRSEAARSAHQEDVSRHRPSRKRERFAELPGRSRPVRRLRTNVEVVRELNVRRPRLGEDATPTALLVEACRASPCCYHVEDRVKSARRRLGRCGVEESTANSGATAVGVNEQPADHTNLVRVQSGRGYPVGSTRGERQKHYVAHDPVLDFRNPSAAHSAR